MRMEVVSHRWYNHDPCDLDTAWGVGKGITVVRRLWHPGNELGPLGQRVIFGGGPGWVPIPRVRLRWPEHDFEGEILNQ